MHIRQLTDRQEIEHFLRRDVFLHLYSLGDLDDAFYPHTRWYGGYAHGELAAVVLIYQAFDPPVLLALAPASDTPALKSLLLALLPELPAKIYAHLSPGLESVFQGRYRHEHHGLHLKLALTGPHDFSAASPAGIVQLSPLDAPELVRLYDRYYPEHAFDPAMLETGFFYGMRRAGELVCAAGVHVVSPAYRVAAIGNVLTRPDYRGQGMAAQVTQYLCFQLEKTVEAIGLNVKASNTPAVRLYEQLGFRHHADYHEYIFVSME